MRRIPHAPPSSPPSSQSPADGSTTSPAILTAKHPAHSHPKASRSSQQISKMQSPSSALSKALVTAISAVNELLLFLADPISQTKLNPGQTINEYSFEHERCHAMNIMDAVSTVDRFGRFVWSGLVRCQEVEQRRATHMFVIPIRRQRQRNISRRHTLRLGPGWEPS